jgi:hypothetical protein
MVFFVLKGVAVGKYSLKYLQLAYLQLFCCSFFDIIVEIQKYIFNAPMSRRCFSVDVHC